MAPGKDAGRTRSPPIENHRIAILARTTRREFQQELQPLDSEHVVEKHVPDAFVHSGLERWLRVRDIHASLVVGVSTNNSVDEGGWRSAGACEPAISPARDRADISEPQGEISKVSSATSSPSALSACTECDDDVPEKLRSVLI